MIPERCWKEGSRAYTFDYYEPIYYITIGFIMRKNPTLKKNTSIASSKHKTKMLSSLSTPKSRLTIPAPRTRKELSELITPKIAQIWEMTSSLGLESSHPSIIRFLAKKMVLKGYANAEIILEVLNTGSISKLPRKKIEEINV